MTTSRAGIRAAVVVVAAASAALTVSSAIAQEVTVEQLVARTIAEAPELAAVRANLNVAAAGVAQASLRPNPTFEASQDLGNHDMAVTTIGVEWPLDFRRRSARVSAARGSADVTSLEVRERERQVATAVRATAGRVLAARRTLDVTNEALVAARRLRDLLDRRVTEGGSTKLDANLTTVEAMRLEAAVALASGELEAATIELKAVAGLAADAPLTLRDTLEGLASAPAIPRLTAVAAMESRPDLREALARIGLADARAELARRDGATGLTMFGGYTRNAFGFPQLGFSHTGAHVPIHGIFHSVTVGARVTLPVTNRNQGLLAAAQAERAGAEALFTARQRAARAEIDAATARERESRRAVELYGNDIRNLARQNVEVMLEAYDLGRFPLSDVLTEQRRYLDVEAGYTLVLQRAYEARTELARAFGEVP